MDNGVNFWKGNLRIINDRYEDLSLLQLEALTEADIAKYDQLYRTFEEEAGAGYHLPQDTRVLLVCGIGNGTWAKHIREKEGVRLLIYEPDPAYFSYLCSKADLSGLLSDDEVHLFLGGIDSIGNGLPGHINVLDMQHLGIIYAPGYRELYPGLLEEIVKAVKAAMVCMSAEYGTTVLRGRLNFRNCLFALSLLHKSYTVEQLFQHIPSRDIPVILVGAGPSLKKNVAQLKRVEQRAIIVSCTRASETLRQYGIEPDLLGSVDMEEGHDYTPSDVERKYRILFLMGAAVDIQRAYAGKGIYFGWDENRLQGIDERKELWGIFTGGSVITAMLSLFREAGFKKFILVGEDLAFSEAGETHIGLSPESHIEEEIYEVRGVNGGTVQARSDWQVFRAFFEKAISEDKTLHVIDATEGGALIRGTEVRRLREVIDELGGERLSIATWLSGMKRGTAGQREHVRSYFSKIESDCGKMQVLLSDGLAWGGRVLEGIRAGDTGEAFQEACREYEGVYHLIIEGEEGEYLRQYAADVVYEYMDRIQFAGNDTQRMLEIERDFMTGLRAAGSELRAYIQQLMLSLDENEG